MEKKRQIERILRDIKSVKIQGARNIALAALKAYSLLPTKETKRKLMNSRPTEPMLVNVLNLSDKLSYKEIFSHFETSQNKINHHIFKLIKNNSIIFTHCHSSSVVNALIYARKKGKRFQIYNTETRPLFQGRKTAKELAKARIRVTSFVDSAFDVALKQADLVLIGCDAILKKGIINKIGSNVIAELASMHKIPFYVAGDSWKFFPEKLVLEQRDFHEAWKNAPRNIKVKNPAFEFVDKKYIARIISEIGILRFDEFIKRVER